jgi:UDP-galactopyranose mutase
MSRDRPAEAAGIAGEAGAVETSGARQLEAPSATPFLRSFWMGGFEGADHLDAQCRPLDMAHAHGHVDQLDEDYARAADLGILTVRESIGWRLCETAPGVFDLSRALRMARCARRRGMQILWTLMHYGTPPDVSLMDDALIDRFAAFAAAVARALADEADEPPIYTLVNEINFLSWAAEHTDMIGPYGRPEAGDAVHSTEHSGYTLKRRLVRATIAGTHAVRRIDPRARFLQVEPLVHVVAPMDRPDLEPLAAQVAGYQWQAWDLLAGRAEPELGGAPDLLDMLGINHYHSGQWEVATEQRLWWHARDPRRVGLDTLLQAAWQRYGRPLLVAETSHVGAGRAAWLGDVASQVERARRAAVPVAGICLYPLVDRPDWCDGQRWHHSGLWDVAQRHGHGPQPGMARLLHRPYAQALARWQQRLPGPAVTRRKPTLLVFSPRRWDLAHGRLQHLMGHLAEGWHIVFVEEPVHRPGAASLVRSAPLPDVEVLQPHTPGADFGFDGDQVLPVWALLQATLGPQVLQHAVAWLATPAALPLVRALGLQPGVYDCTQVEPVAADDPSGRNLWRAREAALLQQSGLVLTAGPAQQRAIGDCSGRAVCVPHGVDAAHFSPAMLHHHGSEAHEAERLLAGLGGVRVGFVGTIDERVDLALLAQLADARPHWHIVLIGPMRLPPGRALPQRPGLHWLGAQPHSLLPYLLARLQVALVPFERGPRTALRHPPQLLEYLAAGKPVVSTPLPDVLALYGGLVDIASDAHGLARACDAALQAAPGPHAQRQARIDALVAQRAWRHAAQTVDQLLLQRVMPAIGLVDVPARQGPQEPEAADVEPARHAGAVEATAR